MKGKTVEIEWRTLQFFLGDQGVAEVSADINKPKKLRCTCQQFQTWARCKHAEYVRSAMKKANGVYIIDIPGEVPKEAEEVAFDDVYEFRQFLLKYGAVVHLD